MLSVRLIQPLRRQVQIVVGSSNGSLTDKSSDIGKRVSYIIDRFKKAGYSGDNISAIIAIGWRESNLNSKAVNPAGSVKGIWQWGAGGINGNRYQNTADTVEPPGRFSV
ncbi:phage tail tip lysozyme [Leuconostoc pseudomesenteroides]|uniref:phage tail tip lysozyme n=1 Tax=Leuconostoc pseudomesenteroides TaxID=33968 RepID=UPI00403E30BE